MKISIDLKEDEVKILNKRAKTNLLTLREQVEDVIRRSCINFKQKSSSNAKIDDKLIEIFSRQRRTKRKKFQ